MKSLVAPLVIGLIAAVGFSGGLADLLFPPQADLPASPQQPAAVSLPLLSHPLGYVATVRDCLPSGRQCSATRYYIAKQERAQ